MVPIVHICSNSYKDLEHDANELSDEANELKQVRKELLMAQAMASTAETELGVTRDVQSYTELAAGGVMDKTAPLEGEKSAAAAAEPSKRMLDLTERFQKLAEQHQELANIEDE